MQDGSDGRRQRRERTRAKAGRMTRAEADAAKRAMCAGSERQRKPEEALGIHRATYYRHKLGTPEDKPKGRPRKANAMTPAERKCRQRAKLPEASAFVLC